MRTQPYSDKKFIQLQKELAPKLRRQGMHLVAHRENRRGSRPHTVVQAVRNHVRQAPWAPSAPKGMRWYRGELIPRHSKAGRA